MNRRWIRNLSTYSRRQHYAVQRLDHLNAMLIGRPFFGRTVSREP